MATITTSNAKRTAVSWFYEGLTMPSDSWTRAYTVRRDDVPELRRSALTGIGNVGTWDGTSDISTTSVSAVTSSGQTLSYQAYAVQVTIGKYLSMDVPGIVAEASQKLGMSVSNTQANKAWTALANAHSSTTVADGTSLVNDSHSTAGGTRDNKLTSALDRTALMSAIQLGRNWINYQDQVFDLVSMARRWVLVVPPALEETAKQVVRSVVSSDQQQLNVVQDYEISIVVAPWLTDANDWFLVAEDMSPLIYWERSGPARSLDVDEDNRQTKITVDMAFVHDADAQPDGIIGAAVS